MRACPAAAKIDRVTRSVRATWWLTALAVVLLCRLAHADDPTAWSRVYLADGQVLVTWGEHTRVDDQVVLQLPISIPAGAEPETRVVTVPATQIDWARTDAWLADVRRARAKQNDAERAYTVFTDDIAAELSDVARASDPAERIRRLEAIRARVKAWPAAHDGYRAEDVAQTLSVIDDILNGMRAAAGQQSFSLALSTGPAVTPPPTTPEAAPPSTQDVVQQALLLAPRVSATERLPLLESVSLLLARAEGVDRDWLARTRRDVSRQVAAERRVITAYVRLREWLVSRASSLLASADVRGLLRLRQQVEQRDRKLKQQRPDDVAALLATLDAQVEAARAHRLALDRWMSRRPVLERYATAVRRHVVVDSPLMRALDDVKALAGPDAAMLTRAEGQLAGARVESDVLVVPEEARPIHQVWVASHQLASRALQTRRTAIARADVALAWEASSAAAGALMLFQQIRDDLDALVRRPAPPTVS